MCLCGWWVCSVGCYNNNKAMNVQKEGAFERRRLYLVFENQAWSFVCDNLKKMKKQ